jgi:hypothetical protein
MLSENINLDKLITDIEQQIDIISAIAADNAILNEQLRLLHESREMILNQQLEIERLAEILGSENLSDHLTIIDPLNEASES